jgi:hypothetical protein
MTDEAAAAPSCLRHRKLYRKSAAQIELSSLFRRTATVKARGRPTVPLPSTFEPFVPYCVPLRNRRGLRLRGGELKEMPVVLVVDDEAQLREIVHDALKEGGFDLTTVASGRETVAMIESGVVKYSALVTDGNLKGPMKGWEIARLHCHCPHDRRCRRRLGVRRRAQQRPAAKAVCSSAIGYGGIPAAQHRLADLTIEKDTQSGAIRRRGLYRPCRQSP